MRFTLFSTYGAKAEAAKAKADAAEAAKNRLAVQQSETAKA